MHRNRDRNDFTCQSAVSTSRVGLEITQHRGEFPLGSTRYEPLVAMLSCFSMRDLRAVDDSDRGSSDSFFFPVSISAFAACSVLALLSNENFCNNFCEPALLGESWMEEVERKESVLSRTVAAAAATSSTAGLAGPLAEPASSSWIKLSRSLARGFCSGAACDAAELSPRGRRVGWISRGASGIVD